MAKNQKLSESVRIAISGLLLALKEERNFRIQSIISVVVIISMLVLGLSPIEESILVLIILVVLSFELINSQIEKFLDIIQPEHHPRVKIIKDFSAGAVLLSSIGSVVVGILIFLPHITGLVLKNYK